MRVYIAPHNRITQITQKERKVLVWTEKVDQPLTLIADSVDDANDIFNDYLNQAAAEYADEHDIIGMADDEFDPGNQNVA